MLASAPNSNTPTPPSLPANGANPAPYMRCVNDFWGNCTGVASNRHDYRWRYVRPGQRPKELRESATARANNGGKATDKEKVVAWDKGAVRENAVLRGTPPASEKAVLQSAALSLSPEKAPAREKVASEKPAREKVAREKVVREVPAPQEKPEPRVKPATREKTVMVKDNIVMCHPRRRVVGDERPSQDDARRAAELGWMGAVRYDYGERYQDINRAKDVRLNCGPSSVSSQLKVPFYRCAVEATPCRETQGQVAEPDERRYDPPTQEDRISRK